MTKMVVKNCHEDVYSGISMLAYVQSYVSQNVPGALDGSRETVVSYMFALDEELHEIARELQWRPWRDPKIPNPDRVIEETADSMAFIGILMVNLAKACGLSLDEFCRRVSVQYEKVSLKNAERFIDGPEKTL